MSETITETAGQSPQRKKKKRRRRTPLILRIFKKIGSVILVSFLSFFLLFLITGTICGIAATA